MNSPPRTRAGLAGVSLALAVCALFAAGGRAEEPTPGSPDLKQLMERLQKLEQRNEELEKTVHQLKDQPQPVTTEVPASEPGKGPPLDDTLIRKIVTEYLDQNPPKACREEQPAQEDGCKRYEVGKNLSFKATWKDGVWFETADKAFTFHVGGRIDFDNTYYSAPKAVSNSIGQFNNYLDPNQGLQDGWDIRRFRLRVDGTMWEQFDYRVEGEFAGGLDLRRRTLGISPTPPATGTSFDENQAPAVRLTDVYLEYKDMPYLGNFRVGHQRETLSFANSSSDNFQPFMERPLIFTAFNNDFQFEDGLVLYRNYWHDRLYTWTGIFRPTDFNSNDNRDGGFSLGDGKYAYDARVCAIPVYMDQGREWVVLGAAYSYREAPADQQVRFRATPEVQSGPSGFLVPNIINTGTLLTQGAEQILNFEVASNWGPLTLTAEWSGARVSNVFTSTNALTVPPPGATAATLRALGLTSRGTYEAQGFYVEALCFLTGGDYQTLRIYQPAYDRVVVNEKAFWKHGPHGSIFGSGAWQVGVRYDYLDLTNSGINGGWAHAVTGGLNWYLNENMKIQWNYVWMNRNFAPTDTAGRQEGDFEGFGMRFHVDF